MKRLLLIAAVLAASFSFAVLPAQAKWFNEPLGWTISSVGTQFNPTGINVRDTAYTVFGGAAVDTTAIFSLDNAMPLLRGTIGSSVTGGGAVATPAYGPYGSDTCVVAYFVIEQDSAATGTITIGSSSATIILEGRAGGFGSAATLAGGWAKADSIVLPATQLATNPTVFYPLRTIGPYGNILAYATYRIRTLANAGLLPAARAWIRYWKP